MHRHAANYSILIIWGTEVGVSVVSGGYVLVVKLDGGDVARKIPKGIK
jgi:hypothetical protein